MCIRDRRRTLPSKLVCSALRMNRHDSGSTAKLAPIRRNLSLVNCVHVCAGVGNHGSHASCCVPQSRDLQLEWERTVVQSGFACAVLEHPSSVPCRSNVMTRKKYAELWRYLADRARPFAVSLVRISEVNVIQEIVRNIPWNGSSKS